MQIRRNQFDLTMLLTPAALLMSAALASGQTNTTGLSGTVSDATGALLPGVVVTATNPATGLTLTEKTGSRGEYSFEQVMPGTYTVHVNASGFNEQVEEVQLLVATPLKINFKLNVGTSETVEVSTGLAAVNSVDATLGKAFDSKQVQTLPYLANNVTYLLSLQPGVLALDSGAQTGGLNTDTRTGIVNGARQDQTNVTLDGVDNNDQTNGYAFNGALRSTRESVEEFRVTTTNANADAGRSSGGQVSLVTRSGSNAVHGAAYEYYRGGIGLQNNWFNKQTQFAQGKNVPAKVLQHTYGAALGLPIAKDKLFFFGAYEGFKQASSQVIQATVPSVPGANGGAPTGLITGNVVYGACAPGATSCSTAASYKTLTPAEIASLDNRKGNTNCSKMGVVCNAPSSNAAALAYFKQFPIANGTSLGDGFNTGSYTFTSPVPLHQITNIARMDYNLNQRQSLFVRGNLQSDNQSTAVPFPGQPANTNIFSNNKGIAAGHTWVISSALTNNFRYGLVRQGVANRGTASQPYVSFSAISTLNGTSTSSKYFITTNNFADDMSFTRGRHTFQFGISDRIVSNSRYFDSPLLSNASISATLLATAAIAGKNTSLDTTPFVGTAACPDCAVVANNFRTFYNSAILANTGVIEYAQSGTEYLVQNNALVPAGAGVVPTHIYRNLEQEYYLQDQWKATPRLTLTAGLRYVYLGTPYEINGQQISPTISLNTFLQNRVTAMNAGNNYNTRISFAPSGSANGAANFWNPQTNNFAPRFAFAYATANNRIAIRGGYAITYDHVGEGIINYYESTSSSLLSLSKTNQFTYTDVDTNPRFTGYSNIPLGQVTATSQTFPVTPGDIPFSFLRSINNVIKTPYAQTFNLSLQHELARGLTMTTSYVGRLGRHLLANVDVAQPLNLVDNTSGQSYFAAATAYDKMIDSGVSVLNVPDSGYFHNIFPNATYTIPSGANKGTYTGARAYYAYLASAARGNETDPLYYFDTDPTASASGLQSFRFFYPQTSSIYSQATVANSNYHALQMSMRHALRYGMVYDLNYTWSKSRDQGSSPERSAANLIVNTFNPAQQYAVSDFDVRHNITADYTIPLPFGHGAPFLTNTNGFVDRLVGGIQLNGTVHYSTAFPFTAAASGNYGTNFLASSYFIKTGDVPSGGHHFVPAAGSTGSYQTALKNGVTPAQAFTNFRYAYAGEIGQRNAFRADGYFSLDSGFSKSFRTFREQNFKLSVEVFNVTGTPRFGGQTSTGASGLTTNGANTRFGQYTTLLNSPRQMQFSGKYTF